MPIYTEQTNGKTTYTVVATTRINGKQVYKKRRNVTSIAAAKRIELDLRLSLARIKEQPEMCTWTEWSEKCYRQGIRNLFTYSQIRKSKRNPITDNLKQTTISK